MKSRRIKVLVFILIPLLVFAIGGLEFFSRFLLGLGDPPLSLADPAIDYIFASNQDCSRFGNRQLYNGYSMRADRDPKPLALGMRRVLVVGDSVVNGGALTTHEDLATTLLDVDMRKHGLGDCWNISAGSWGPMNYVAYFKKFGTFGATDLVLEVNDHDLWEDDPKDGAGRIVGTANFPDKKPVLAAWEAFDRYALPRLKGMLGKRNVSKKVDVAHAEDEAKNERAKKNLAACASIYSLPIERKFLVVHRTRTESSAVGGGGAPLGETAFVEQARALGVKVLYLGLNPQLDYRDVIHPNVNGQKKLYQLLKKELGLE